MELLAQHLSPTQRTQYERFKYFDVVGGDSGRRYRIRHEQLLNVELLDEDGHRVCVLCFMPEGHLPIGDTMLAQKLALELFEGEALKVAHKSPAWDETAAREMYRRRLQIL
jgi:hypothetical protein